MKAAGVPVNSGTTVTGDELSVTLRADVLASLEAGREVVQQRDVVELELSAQLTAAWSAARAAAVADGRACQQRLVWLDRNGNPDDYVAAFTEYEGRIETLLRKLYTAAQRMYAGSLMERSTTLPRLHFNNPSLWELVAVYNDNGVMRFRSPTLIGVDADGGTQI